MGPPGSGKGAQCERLYVQFNFAHISSGDLLRSKVAGDPVKYRQAFNLMQEGKPVPNEVVTAILAEGMIDAASKEHVEGFLIDNYPLDESQAAVFEEFIGEPTIILFLGQVNDIKLGERLKNRSNFDDSKDSIAKRLSTFAEKTKPIMNKYKNQLYAINGDQGMEEVNAEIKTIFSKHQFKECPKNYLI
jgi:adenylate kinase family enzyme